MAKRSKTITERKLAERVLRLEFKQAKELVDVLKETSQDISKTLEGLSDDTPNAKRLKELKKSIDESTKLANQRLRNKGKLKESLEDGLDASQRLVQDSSKIPSTSDFHAFTPVLPLDALAIAKSEYIDSITSVTDEIKKRALSETKKSIALGEGVEDLKRRIIGTGVRGSKGRDGVFRRASWRAEMIARNTVNDLSNRGRLEGFKQIHEEFPELKIQLRWSAAGDSRVSDICRNLNGQIRAIGENFETVGFSGQHPPAHVNCRSAVVSESAKYTPEVDQFVRSRAEQSPNIPTFEEASAEEVDTLEDRFEAKRNLNIQGKLIKKELSTGSKLRMTAATDRDTDGTPAHLLLAGEKINKKSLEGALKEWNGETYDLFFTLDGEFDSNPNKSRKQAMREAMEIRKTFPEMLSKVDKGSFIHNDPVGGADGGRARIYKKLGFSESTSARMRQWAIVDETAEGKKFLKPIDVYPKDYTSKERLEIMDALFLEDEASRGFDIDFDDDDFDITDVPIHLRRLL